MSVKKYFTTYSISVRNGLYYTGNVFGGSVFYVIVIYIFFSLWSVIYKDSAIAGYTFTQMIWYICMAEVIIMSTGGGWRSQISDDIKSGAIAYQLGRPYNYIWYQFANFMGSASIKMVIFTTIALVLGIILVGLPPVSSIVMLPFFIISVLLSIGLQFFILMSLALSAFFVEENRPFFFIYNKLILILGTFVPIEFFPQWMQSILRYMPFSLVAWAPSKMLVSFSMSHAMFAIPMQLGWLIIFIGIAMSVYKRGVKQIHVNGG